MSFSDKFRFANHTDVGRSRKQNEDAMGFFECPNGNGYVFIVCDGMGGHVGGATASNTAIKAIRYSLEKDYFADPRQAIRESIKFANREIYQRAKENPDLRGMGTTCVMVIYRDGQCYIGHVGDSRLYLYRDGLLERVTKDHSFVQMLVDQGVISDAEAESHPRRNEILRALGTESSVDVEVRILPFAPQIQDTLLLCSDGLNSMLTDDQIEHILDGFTDISQKALDLVEAANHAGGLDNITVQLVQFLVGTAPEDTPRPIIEQPRVTKTNLTVTDPLGITPNPMEEGVKKKVDETVEHSPKLTDKSTATHVKKRHVDDEDLIVSENAEDAGKLRKLLFQVFGGIFGAVFLYVMVQTVFDDVNFLGSQGSLKADSLKAIELQQSFYKYFWNSSPELKQVKKTIDDTKQTLHDLQEMKKKAKKAVDDLFQNDKVTQIKNQLSNNFSSQQLEELAKKYKSKVEWILKANGLKDKQDLKKLDSIFIPKTPPQGQSQDEKEAKENP